MKRISVALVALTLFACGAERHDDTGQQQSDILGGTTTLARPELGFLSTSVGGCSATLIDSKHFVTAAHCINYESFYNSGGSFRVDPANGGASQFFNIDRAFAQSVSGQIGSGDIAIGRLSTSVPSSLATPASISTIEPSNTWLTVMGYGCNASDGSGAGIKRYKEYFYTGQTTRYLCPGDSGGPIFLGQLASRGAMVRINSGIACDLLDCEDVGADPVTYRGQILALASGMETTGVCYRAFLENIGWQGTVCNNAVAGTTGQSRRLEANQIWSARPGVVLCYKAYVQDLGWLPEVCDGNLAGTVGQSRRLEALTVRVASPPTGISVFYNLYLENIGWQGERSNGQVAGTTGQSRRVEAMTVRLVP